MSDLKSLLPSNTSQGLRDFEQVTARLGDLPIEIHKLWNPAECPAHLLGWLAWALSVDVWETEWDEETKRNVAAASADIHKIKGTKKAVKHALESVGIPNEISEWFQHGGEPYTFFMEFTATDIFDRGYTLSPAFVQLIDRVIANTKPVRSHYQVRVNETVTNDVYVSPAFGEVMIDDAAMIMEMP